MIEQNIPFLSSNHATKLFKEMFPGKIFEKCACGRTKATYRHNGVIVPKAEKSSDIDGKLFLFVIRHHDSKMMVVTSLLDLLSCIRATDLKGLD